MTRTVFVSTVGSPGDWQPVVKMFKEEDWIVTQVYPGESPPDLVCFTGGSDVSPYLYGEENISSYCDPKRDEYEKELYEHFLSLSVPMVGICRGGQLLNVLNGGSMIQHIEGHSMGVRKLKWTFGAGRESPIEIHEDHHQGIDPHGLDNGGRVLAMDPRDGNIEIMVFTDTNCLCFQPHPEWGHQPTKELFFELLEEYLF